MPSESKVFSLIPKEHLGTISSRRFRSASDYLGAFWVVQNCFLEDGTLLARTEDFKLPSDNDTRLAGVPSNGNVWATHIFNCVDTSSATALPTTVLLYAVEIGGVTTLYRADTAAVVTVNGVNISTSSINDFWFLNIKNRCFVSCRAASTNVIPAIIERFPNQTSYPWGIARPLASLGYTPLLDLINDDLGIFFEGSAADVTNGSASVTRSGSDPWDDSGAWDGKFVLLDGVEYQISAVTTDAAMTLSTNYTGASGTVNIKVFYGTLAWTDTPPQYAYAYYNSDTGHISSISPILQVSDQNIPGVNIGLTSIPVTDNDVYDRIVIFRTARDGGLLLPLRLDSGASGTATVTDGMIDNTVAAGGYSYVDAQPDNELGRILGVFSAPIDNGPPPTDIKFMEYWDGRVWLTTISQPFLLRFSGSPAQTPLGVPEECFPETNIRPIPSDDGFITGLKAVGNGLTVYTDRYVYSVEGNYEGNYRLVRVSSRGSGVSQYAVDAHPGDSSNESASVVYLSRDKRLWRQFPGGRIDDIGWQIQDELDQIGLGTARPAVVKVAQLGKKWFIVVAYCRTTNQPLTAFYDVDQDFWTQVQTTRQTAGGSSEERRPTIASGIIYTGSNHGTPALLIGTSESNILSIGASSPAVQVAADAARVTTHAIDMGDPENYKTLQEVIVYSKAGSWEGATLTVYYDSNCYTFTNGNALTYIGTGTPRDIDANAYRFVVRSDSVLAKKVFRSMQFDARFPNAGNATKAGFDRVDFVYGIAATDVGGRP